MRTNSAGSVTLTDVFFSGNSTGGNGGGYSNSSTATLTNVTFSGNSASNWGGGLYNGQNGVSTLTNVTFSGNSATTGGGINNNLGTVNLKNTIVANSPSGGNCVGTITDSGHNLDSGDTCGFSTANHDLINVDPKLAPLQYNGGYTPTMALSKKSPAVDKGTNNGCPTTDQRGEPRPVDGNGDGKVICDIGAFEYQP